MTDRERWIVYPLLFLALGAALRDKLAKQTRAKQIVCEELYIVDNEGRPLSRLAGNELRLDLAGPSYGYLTAGLIDGHTVAQRGKPVAVAPRGGGSPGGVNLQGLSLGQVMQLLSRMGVQLTPRPTRPTAPADAAPSAPLSPESPRVSPAPPGGDAAGPERPSSPVPPASEPVGPADEPSPQP